MLDWNMPIMGGPEACQKIKSLYDNYNTTKQKTINVDELEVLQ